MKIQSELRETLSTLLMASAGRIPSYWLELCNNVLSGASEKLSQPEGDQDTATGTDKGAEDDEDKASFAVKATVRKVAPTRWQSKVCLCATRWLFNS